MGWDSVNDVEMSKTSCRSPAGTIENPRESVPTQGNATRQSVSPFLWEGLRTLLWCSICSLETSLLMWRFTFYLSLL